MTRKTILMIILAVLGIGSAWFNLLAALSGLTTRTLPVEGIPMHYLAPTDAEDAPAVLIAHGFAGSQQLMRGYGYTLAHAGYAVLLWDFGGHAANGQPLQREGDTLQTNIALAYETLLEQREVDPNRDSMGSGAVMTAGINHPEQYQAVVAISPTSAEMSPTAPRNLLMQAGAWERPFVDNAQRLLEEAGGEDEDIDSGLARQFVLIPNVEHITILFNQASHTTALNWLNDVFEHETQRVYQDTRI